MYPLKSPPRQRAETRRSSKILGGILRWRDDLRRRLQITRRRFAIGDVIWPAVALLVFGLGYLGLLSPVFSLRVVEVETTPENDAVGAESLRQEIIKRVLGKNLLFMGVKKLDFLVADPTVAGVKIEKRWTNGLRVTVEKRVAKAQLIDSQKRAFLIDKDGAIFAQGMQADLPVIQVAETLSLGQQVAPDKVSYVIALLSYLTGQDFLVEWVSLGEDCTLKISGGPEVWLSFQGARDQELMAILKSYRSRGIALVKIDMRSPNPVISYY